MQSDPEDEYEEILLKARAPMQRDWRSRRGAAAARSACTRASRA